METSDCLRSVRPAAQVIDAGWFSAPQRKRLGFGFAPVSDGLERIER